MQELPPYRLILEFARADQASDPHAFRFAAQSYLLRSEGGVFESTVFSWEPALLDDLAAVRLPGRDPAVVQRLGETLRSFLAKAGWSEHEASIIAACQSQQRVIITIRSAAAELYALPWELLTLKATGQHLAELPEVVVRYEWPTAHSFGPQAPTEQPGRILLAWSAAGGEVPIAEHLSGIAEACRAGAHPFDAVADVLPDASCGRLTQALETAVQKGHPIAILHLLCHGSVTGTTFGLALDPEEPGGPQTVVDAGSLRQLLGPFAPTLRLVVLAACDSGNSGELGNQLGSVAQALHRAGITAVVASRFPLSVGGSTRLTEKLYHGILVGPSSLESAVLQARRHMALDAGQIDWASLQLYSRAANGDDTRPLALRPYRGLLAFQSEHSRFFFGREPEISEITTKLQALIDSKQPRFLIVAGASGTGKSSLVLAGAAPRLLAAGAYQRVLYLRPSAEAVSQLDALQASLSTRKESVLVVIDQGEELFTMTTRAEVREALPRRLWALACAADSGVSVLVTLRVDFIGRGGEILLDDAGLRLDRVAYGEAHRVFITQLSHKSLVEIMNKPAAAVGLMLEDGLTSRILVDLGSEPGVLPLLEDTLDLLWQRRSGNLLTQAAYDAVGGVTGALHGRADALIDGLTAAEQRIARRLLVRLVSVGDDLSLGTRRRLALSELRPTLPKDGEGFDKIIAKLVSARLLVIDRPSSSVNHETIAFVEIAHEALIRKWPRLASWVAEDRVILAQVARVEEWVDAWRRWKTRLHGDQLGYARDVQQRYPDYFSADVQQLLSDSEKWARSRRWRIVWLSVLLFCVSVVVSIFVLVGSVVLLYIADSKKQEMSDRPVDVSILTAGVPSGTASLRVIRKLDGKETSPVQTVSGSFARIPMKLPQNTAGVLQIEVEALAADTRVLASGHAEYPLHGLLRSKENNFCLGLLPTDELKSAIQTDLACRTQSKK